MMTAVSIKEKREKIIKKLNSRKLAIAFELIQNLIQEVSAWGYEDEYEKNLSSYKYLLGYYAAGVTDCERENIYAQIISNLYTLVDNVAIDGFTKLDGSMGPYQMKKNIESAPYSLPELFANHQEILNAIDCMNLLSNADIDKQSLIAYQKKLETVENDIFNHLWLLFPLKSSDVEAIEQAINSDAPTYLKELIVSGLGLGLINYYDATKVKLLSTIYLNDDMGLSVKALCLLMLSMFVHRDRVCNMDQKGEEYAAIFTKPSFAEDIKILLLEFLRCSDSEKVSTKINQEIIPKLMDMYPDFIKKIRDADMTVDLSDIGVNPKWKDIIEGEKFTQKIEELNKMQIEGGDVFGGMFAKLKTFPFFDKVSNWFIPFRESHSALAYLNEKGADVISKTLSNINVFCSSDKYSLCLMLKNLPDAQRQTVLSQFGAMQEYADDANIQPALDKKSIANKFILNVYRFFTLNKRNVLTNNPFSERVDLLKLNLLWTGIDMKGALSSVSTYYLNQKLYEEAAIIYQQMLAVSPDCDAMIFQKLGYCHQQSGNYEQAIHFYKRYELFSDDIWVFRHIALCYKMRNNHEQALIYYRKAENCDAENASICLGIGHELLAIHQPEEALKYYFKNDYLSPNSHNAWRPIAWCSFLIGNFQQSEKYYLKIIEKSPLPDDYLNLGHVYLLQRDIDKATLYYKEYLKNSKSTIDDFVKAIETDRMYLVNDAASFDVFDLNLSLDAIILRLTSL